MNDTREAVARALYESEHARSIVADDLVAKANGRPFRDMMESWEESAEIFRADADAVLEAIGKAATMSYTTMTVTLSRWFFGWGIVALLLLGFAVGYIIGH